MFRVVFNKNLTLPKIRCSTVLVSTMLFVSSGLMAQAPTPAPVAPPSSNLPPLPLPPDITKRPNDQRQAQHHLPESSLPSQANPTITPIPTNPLPPPATIMTSVPSSSPQSGMDALDRIRNNSKADRIYTWKDSDGKIHVTNTPPADIIKDTSGKFDPKLITITGQKSTAGKSYQDQIKDLDEQRLKEKEKASKENEVKQAEAQKRLQCDQLKGRISLYSSSRAIATVGSDGKDNIVSDDQRKSTLETLQSSYGTLCGQ